MVIHPKESLKFCESGGRGRVIPTQAHHVGWRMHGMNVLQRAPRHGRQRLLIASFVC